MNHFAQAAVALVQGALTGAIGYGRFARVWAQGHEPTKISGPLSARRIRILSIISEVVPSKIGDAKFSKIAPGYKRVLENGEVVSYHYTTKLPKSFTGCGFLPCYVGRVLGDALGFSGCGLESARKNAKAQDAWVEAGGSARPSPGDIILLVNAQNVPTHIGMFIGFNEDGSWKTADAGQANGVNEDALYVKRTYDPVNVTLNGRKLAGWVNVDKLKIRDAASVSGQVVDVRTDKEFAYSHAEGAINVHVDDIACPESPLPLDANRPVFVYCRTGGRSRRAAHLLSSRGYDVTDLGGWSLW